MQVLTSVNGLYMLEVRLNGYNNPTGRCQGCVSETTPNIMGCCDQHNTTLCSGFLMCDSYFYYCLRALGSQGGSCSYFGNMTSSSIFNDASIDFSQSTVLDLDNPLLLPGLTNAWNVSLNEEINRDIVAM